MKNISGIARVRVELLDMSQDELCALMVSRGHQLRRSTLQDYERGAPVPDNVREDLTRVVQERKGTGTVARRWLGLSHGPDDDAPTALKDPSFNFHVREDLAAILESGVPATIKLKLARAIRQEYKKGVLRGWISNRRGGK